MRLDGGAPCLDFVNTVPDRKDGSGRDNLGSMDDLLYWARKAGVITDSIYSALGRIAAKSPGKARAFFEEAIAARSLIYSIFFPISLGRKIATADLERFNALRAQYAPHLVIGQHKDRVVEQWAFPPDSFHLITATLIRSANQLLLSDRLRRVKECPNCGWLFLDTTKNGKRRWCSMEDCGSNVKALEYYYRHKKG